MNSLQAQLHIAHVNVFTTSEGYLHPKDTPLTLPLHSRILPTARHLQAHTQNPSCVLRRDDAVVPESRGPKCSLALMLDPAPKLRVRLADRGHDRGELFSAHDGGFGVGPVEEETGRVCAAAVSPLVSARYTLCVVF